MITWTFFSKFYGNSRKKFISTAFFKMDIYLMSSTNMLKICGIHSISVQCVNILICIWNPTFILLEGKSSRISKFASQNLISITYFTNFFRCKESFLLFVACRIRNICLTTTTPNFLKFPLLKQRKEMKKSYQDFFLSTPYVIFADWLCVTKVS